MSVDTDQVHQVQTHTCLVLAHTVTMQVATRVQVNRWHTGGNKSGNHVVLVHKTYLELFGLSHTQKQELPETRCSLKTPKWSMIRGVRSGPLSVHRRAGCSRKCRLKRKLWGRSQRCLQTLPASVKQVKGVNSDYILAGQGYQFLVIAGQVSLLYATQEMVYFCVYLLHSNFWPVPPTKKYYAEEISRQFYHVS